MGNCTVCVAIYKQGAICGTQREEGKSNPDYLDELLRPAIEARRAGKPYAGLIADIPEYETDLISTYRNLSHLHRGLGLFTAGYSSDSEYEVNIEFEDDQERNEAGDEIMMILGYPFFPNRGD